MNGSAERSVDLTRTGFQVLALGGLVVVSFWIVQPFLMATAWGTMLAVATWPLLLRVEAWVGRRRSIAVIVMTTALLLVLIVPVYFGVTAIVDNTTQIAAWSNVVARRGLPPPPVWVSEIPLVGTRVMARWREAAAVTPEELASRLAPVATTAVLWFVGQVGNLTLLLVQLVLTLFVVVVAYANGETFGDAMERFARRVAGGHGDEAVHLAARAVRAVALGVIVTALAQAALVGLGFAVAGVPFAAILTALAFILSIAQIGPGLVLIGATVWVYVRSGVVWGTVFLVWAIVCGTLDNVLRPALIKRGVDLPLLLVFAGVVGGLVAFGVIGLFVGPVVLAVAYTFLVEWVSAGSIDEHRVVRPGRVAARAE